MDATPPDPDTPEGNAERSDALATPDATPVRPSAASRGPGPRERLAAWVGGALRSTEEALNEAVAPNHRVSCRPNVTVQLRAQRDKLRLGADYEVLRGAASLQVMAAERNGTMFGGTTEKLVLRRSRLVAHSARFPLPVIPNLLSLQGVAAIDLRTGRIGAHVRFVSPWEIDFGRIGRRANLPLADGRAGLACNWDVVSASTADREALAEEGSLSFDAGSYMFRLHNIDMRMNLGEAAKDFDDDR